MKKKKNTDNLMNLLLNVKNNMNCKMKSFVVYILKFFMI